MEVIPLPKLTCRLNITGALCLCSKGDLKRTWAAWPPVFWSIMPWVWLGVCVSYHWMVPQIQSNIEGPCLGLKVQTLFKAVSLGTWADSCSNNQIESSGFMLCWLHAIRNQHPVTTLLCLSITLETFSFEHFFGHWTVGWVIISRTSWRFWPLLGMCFYMTCSTVFLFIWETNVY